MKRVLVVLGVVAATGVTGACSGTHESHRTGSHDSASITIEHSKRTLDVTACTTQATAVHVVAQAAGGWTLDLRQDGPNHSSTLVLVHNATAGVQTYQASANVVHPKGNPPTQIAVSQRGERITGTATLLRAATGPTGQPVAQDGSKTTAASFDVTCHPTG